MSMNREEALVEYNENIVKSLVEEARNKFEQLCNDNEVELENRLVGAFRDLIQKCNDECDRGEDITIFQYEMLRSNILNESYIIYLHGYNKNWYLDDKPLCIEIDLKFIFEPYIELKEKLLREKKIYLGKVNSYDVQNIIFNSVIEAFKELSEALRTWFWDVDEEDYVMNNLKSEFYLIKISEYESGSETVFAMDNRIKNNRDIEEYMKYAKGEAPLVYSVWKNSEFTNMDLSDNPMVLINFKGSKLQNVNFTNCAIARGNYKDTELIECNFNKCNLVASVFENAVISETSFEETFATNMDFTKCKFKGVSFKNADLRQSLFIDTEFEDVNFEGANVENCIFDLDVIPYIHLSAAQLQTVRIRESKEVSR